MPVLVDVFVEPVFAAVLLLVPVFVFVLPVLVAVFVVVLSTTVVVLETVEVLALDTVLFVFAACC